MTPDSVERDFNQDIRELRRALGEYNKLGARYVKGSIRRVIPEPESHKNLDFYTSKA